MHITEIKINERQRELDASHAEELAESIRLIGLVQPIVVNNNLELLAGRHRLEALRLNNITELVDGVHYITRKDLTSYEEQLLELDENVKRLSLEWKAKCKAISNIYNIIKQNEHTLNHNDIAKRIGYDAGYVSYMLKINAAITQGDDEIINCKGPREAILVFVRRAEQGAITEQAKRRLDRGKSTILGLFNRDGEVPNEGNLSPMSILSGATQDNLSPEGFAASVAVSICHNMDCLTYMSQHPHSVDHIISDPPYGIDMSMLSQENTGMNDVARVEATHDVENNLSLFRSMIPAMYNVLKDDGFCVLFCDAMNFRFLHDLGVNAGFKVCRWPLTWNKTHTCLNQAANYNFTKATEIAIVMRKGKATLISPQTKNYYMCSNDEKTSMHPFEKPQALWRWIIDAVSIENQTILDPFAGVGSCTLATIMAKRNPIAVELDEKHFPFLVENVNNLYTKLLKANGTI